MGYFFVPCIGRGAGAKYMADGSQLPVSSSRSRPKLDGLEWGEKPNEGLVCVECGSAILYVYKEYSKGNIRLHRCVSIPQRSGVAAA